MTHGEHNTLSFHLDIERITRANSQPAPKRPGKNDLAFGGDSRLHGKTILPPHERHAISVNQLQGHTSFGNLFSTFHPTQEKTQ
jgi:hypothetical protein